MTTVAQLAAYLATLPQDAEVRVRTGTLWWEILKTGDIFVSEDFKAIYIGAH